MLYPNSWKIYGEIPYGVPVTGDGKERAGLNDIIPVHTPRNISYKIPENRVVDDSVGCFVS